MNSLFIEDYVAVKVVRGLYLILPIGIYHSFAIALKQSIENFAKPQNLFILQKLSEDITKGKKALTSIQKQLRGLTIKVNKEVEYHFDVGYYNTFAELLHNISSLLSAPAVFQPQTYYLR